MTGLFCQLRHSLVSSWLNAQEFFPHSAEGSWLPSGDATSRWGSAVGGIPCGKCVLRRGCRQKLQLAYNIEVYRRAKASRSFYKEPRTSVRGAPPFVSSVLPLAGCIKIGIPINREINSKCHPESFRDKPEDIYYGNLTSFIFFWRNSAVLFIPSLFSSSII
jgi:hypothetical protein